MRPCCYRCFFILFLAVVVRASCRRCRRIVCGCGRQTHSASSSRLTRAGSIRGHICYKPLVFPTPKNSPFSPQNPSPSQGWFCSLSFSSPPLPSCVPPSSSMCRSLYLSIHTQKVFMFSRHVCCLAFNMHGFDLRTAPHRMQNPAGPRSRAAHANRLSSRLPPSVYRWPKVKYGYEMGKDGRLRRPSLLAPRGGGGGDDTLPRPPASLVCRY